MIGQTFTLVGRPKVVFRWSGVEASAVASRSTENSRPSRASLRWCSTRPPNWDRRPRCCLDHLIGELLLKAG
jgi:hypothetical protein